MLRRISVSLLLTVPVSAWFALAAGAEVRVVTLLHTNDIESVYEPVEAFWNPEIERIGGIPHLATLIDRTREQEELSFLFDAGDIFTGALSQASEGRLAFDLYGLMGYDAVNLGNHEFEYGWQSLQRIKQRARFPVLSANLFYEGTDIELCQAYTILEKDGFRIGVIGAMGVDAFINAINPAHRKGIEVRPPGPIVQAYVDELRDEVDLIVVLTHQNRTAPMQTDKEADPEVQRGFDEDYALAGELRGVDVIFGGHSDHGLWEPVSHPGSGTLIGLTFGQGKYLGLMRLRVDTESGTVELEQGRLIPVDSDELPGDPEILERIDAARERAPELSAVVGAIDALAFRRYYRESTLGNLLADILQQASGADIAVMNSGSLRADFNPGEVTAEDVLNVYPFIGRFHVVEISGDAVRELLEYSYALHYGYAQMAGVEATYDSRRPVGEMLIEARVNGEPLDPMKRYTVASSAFLANGGDGYSMLAAGRLVRESSARMSQSFLDYFRENRHVSVPAVGRQRDLARSP
jgi:2',3'-cyclic-nucleotide 2'-phosphodiesterase (5'-nucleotidase family)